MSSQILTASPGPEIREPDPEVFQSEEARWRAVQQRDARADGAFYYAVKTTGVYCRPHCAARGPRRENVNFYDSRQEAEAAGFRACLRCKPDRPEREKEQIALIERACRRIETSEEMPTLGELAAEAGFSAYHFHRIFKRHTGVTPKAYGQAQRNRKMRAGLRSGETVTDAIYDAGYQASSRFYEESKVRLGMTPTQFKKGGAGLLIRYAITGSPLGPILIAATEKGVCLIHFGESERQLQEILRRHFPRAEHTDGDARFGLWVEQILIAISQGKSASPDLPLDIRGTAFQQQVWQALRNIPAGVRASYTEVAAKIGRERDDENSDLLYITNLSPGKIVFGKLASGMVTTALFFLAAMPFLSLTYFLRGIDIPTILIVIAGVYLITVAMIQIFIFMACFAPNRATRAILGLLGLSATITLFTTLTSILGRGLLGGMVRWFSWEVAGWFSAAFLFLTGSFFLFSVAALKPPVFNRSAPIRIWFSTWWLLVLTVGAWISRLHEEFFVGWAIFGTILGMLAFMVTICEREELSARIRLGIPRSKLKRFVAFFFGCGAAGGMAWSTAILVISLTVISLVHQPRAHHNLRDPFIGMAVYACCYALSSHLLYRRLFSGRLSKGYTWILLLGLLLLGTFLPWIISFLVLDQTGMDIEGAPFLFFTNPFTVLEDDFAKHIFPWIFCWLIVVVVFELPWLLRQIRTFQPNPDPGGGPGDSHGG